MTALHLPAGTTESLHHNHMGITLPHTMDHPHQLDKECFSYNLKGTLQQIHF